MMSCSSLRMQDYLEVLIPFLLLSVVNICPSSVEWVFRIASFLLLLNFW
jgi:hypothetical protein